MVLKKSTVIRYCSIFLAMISAGCTQGYLDVQDIGAPPWNPHLAIPLINSNLSLDDVISTDITGDLVQQDSTGFLTVIYQGALSSLIAKQLITIQDQHASQSFVMTGPDIATLQGIGTLTMGQSVSYPFVVNGDEKIDSVVLKSSEITIQLSSDFKHNGNLVIHVPRLTRNGIPFNKTIPVQFQGSSPTVVVRNYDLSGYKFDLTKGAGSYNEFSIDFQLNVINSGNPVLAGEQATITISFEKNEFAAIYGYVGKHTLNFDQDSVKLDIFNNTIDGTIWFEDPEFNLRIRNSYGCEISGTFNVLEAYHKTNGNMAVAGPGIPNPLVINYPAIGEIGQYKTTQVNLNKSSTNVRDVIAFMPHYIIHQIDGNVNPSGNTNYNFVLDTSAVKVDFEIILPMHGKASGFSLRDTIAFELDDISPDKSVEIESLLFKLVTKNGFPVDVGMQLYFTDSLYQTLDSLVNPNENLMNSGAVNSDGKVVSSTETLKYISFSKERIDHIFDARHIIIRADLGTVNQGNDLVKFYAENHLGVLLGAQVKLKVDTK